MDYNENYSVWYFGTNVTSMKDFNQYYTNATLRSDVIFQMYVGSAIDLLCKAFFSVNRGQSDQYDLGYMNGLYLTYPAANYRGLFVDLVIS